MKAFKSVLTWFYWFTVILTGNTILLMFACEFLFGEYNKSILVFTIPVSIIQSSMLNAKQKGF